MTNKERRPLAIMMSKRANAFYLEHVRVKQMDDRIVYLTETGQPVEQIVNIPDKNTSFVLLGKGSSITDAAMRKFAESNVVVGFCGSGGSPLFGMTDYVFLSPQDEYRPTEYMQSWCGKWFNEAHRLTMAKDFLAHRISLCKKFLPSVGDCIYDELKNSITCASSAMELLTAEARYAKSIYAIFSRQYDIPFTRNAGAKKQDKTEDVINSFLDHGNYLAYGYAAVALHTLGISFAFPVLHGKTRRGALVFDVADLAKDWLVLPLAFEAGVKKWDDQKFRAAVIEHAIRTQLLDELITFVKMEAIKSP